MGEVLTSPVRAVQPDDRRDTAVPPHPNPAKEKAIRRRGDQDTRTALYRLAGVDLTRIDGISTGAAQIILTEVGLDLSAFPSEKPADAGEDDRPAVCTSMTSNLGYLTSRFQRRLATEREEIEATAAREPEGARRELESRREQCAAYHRSRTRAACPDPSGTRLVGLAGRIDGRDGDEVGRERDQFVGENVDRREDPVEISGRHCRPPAGPSGVAGRRHRGLGVPARAVPSQNPRLGYHRRRPEGLSYRRRLDLT